MDLEGKREGDVWGLPLKSVGNLAVPLVKVLTLLHINVARLGFSSHPLWCLRMAEDHFPT